MKITSELLKQHFTKTIIDRGRIYYHEGLVQMIALDDDSFEAVVEGSESYTVHARMRRSGLHMECDCPYWTNCKHMVAALLLARDLYNSNSALAKHRATDQRWRIVLNRVLVSRTAPLRPYVPEWKIGFLVNVYNNHFEIGVHRIYLRKDGSFNREDRTIYADDSLLVQFAEPEFKALEFLQSRRNASRAGAYYSGFSYSFMYTDDVGKIWELLKSCRVYLGIMSDRTAITFSDQAVSASFLYKDCDTHYDLCMNLQLGDETLHDVQKFHVMGRNPLYLLREYTLFPVNNLDDGELLLPFITDQVAISIPKSDMELFLSEAYPRLRERTPLPLPEGVEEITHTNFREKQILLTEEADLLKIRLQFLYGDTVISYENDAPQSIFAREKCIIHIQRDLEAEGEAAAIFSELRVRRVKDEGWSVPDSRAVKWLFTHIPLFFEKGFTILGQDQLQRYRVRTGTPQIRVSLSSDLDWFDVNLDVQIEGIKVPMKELMKSIRTRSSIVKLFDNSLAQLPEDWFTKFSHLFHFSRHEEHSIKVAHVHAVMLEHLFHDVPFETKDESFKEQVKRLVDFEGIVEQSVPQGFQGNLRPYQKAGYDWLFFLQRYRFGGCLADDMGLGKTIQTLALLLYGKENGVQKPSLIICPTSVVFNWEQEIVKFAPQLITMTHTGQNREREGEPFKGIDVVLTTYGVMLRDYPFLQQTTFHYIILDEAQKIKNPVSQTSGVVRLLHSDHRLALTGTPVENGTIELWSLFAFLNPGLLGSIHYFRKAFALQIEKYGDGQAAGLLQKMIFPFILRRTKENVAPELPPRMEQIFWCETTPQQKEVYDRWRDYFRAKILKQIDEEGLDQSRMNVLEGLLRLRQIACHPSLVESGSDGDSGKFDALIDLVEEIVQGGHKLLLFSQFVKMLDIIRPRLAASGIVYEYLDGSTKNRKERVQHFQNDAQVKAFLISLKAGGAGLNLTAADYVIHYDPWWNPAVEKQASDRTHRIGQDKKVFIYKLITRGTVEEKILTLQERKAELVKDLIAVEGGLLKMLGREEIEALFS